MGKLFYYSCCKADRKHGRVYCFIPNIARFIIKIPYPNLIFSSILLLQHRRDTLFAVTKSFAIYFNIISHYCLPFASLNLWLA